MTKVVSVKGDKLEKKTDLTSHYVHILHLRDPNRHRQESFVSIILILQAGVSSSTHISNRMGR